MRAWETRFRLERRSAQRDLQFGRRNNLVTMQNGKYVLSQEVRDEDVVRLGFREFSGHARRDNRFSGSFGKTDITNWLQGRRIEGLPRDPAIFTSARVDAIVNRLVASDGVVLRIRGRSNSYSLSAVDPVRRLPSSWSGTNVRERYYIVGSGFGSAANQVWQRGRTRIERAIDAAQSGNLGRWNALVRDEIRPASDRNNFRSSSAQITRYLTRSEYDVDHTLPLARHWTQGGYNATQATRHRIAGGSGNLALMHSSLNRSKQAEGARYQPFSVGPNFRGPGQHPHEADRGVLFENYR
jgi:hypothetical protein